MEDRILPPSARWPISWITTAWEHAQQKRIHEEEMGLTSDFTICIGPRFSVILDSTHCVQIEGNGTQFDMHCNLQMLDDVVLGPWIREISHIREKTRIVRH